MRINYAKIGNYSINKAQIHGELEKQTVKIDTAENSNNLYPLVPVHTAKQLIYSNDLLEKCIRILSQDTVLSEMKFLHIDGEEAPTEITDFWNIENIYQLYLAVQEYYAYGFGACEIITNNNGEVKELAQIPAESLYIKKETRIIEGNEVISHYAVQQVGKYHYKMRLSHFDYDETDADLPLVLWIGSGKTSDFYNIPYWIPAFNKVSANITLDELNAKKIEEGNLLSGILTVISPPLRPELNAETGEFIESDGREQIENILQDQMSDAGTGIMTLHLEQLTADLPLSVQYIPITEQNYDYLSKLADDCDSSVLRCFSIPKIRLMIDDVKESMNSNKSDTIWEIYTKVLETEQMPFESIINKFNRKYFKFTGIVDISIPIFSDKKQIEIKNIIDLFDTGLMTLGEAITKLKQFVPEITTEVDEKNPIFQERYYHGQVFGLADYNSAIDDNQMGELYELFNVLE